ncbi:MarR family transcriptional regulator [Paraglaciecola sp.]|uniref:MarR family transcriptional regulator n=1 Tax=Paraglaciecola sp. TaxID=1920173 RepID=UPI003EF4D8A3
MSTRFTQKGVPLVDSQTLQLIQSASLLADVAAKYLSAKLLEMGYQTITPSLLSFLSVLECGTNYGSEIARNLGVSRQMVAKTVKELCKLGFLKQEDGVGKQKSILFTDNGEKLMADARQILLEVDHILLGQKDNQAISKVIQELGGITEVLSTEAKK